MATASGRQKHEYARIEAIGIDAATLVHHAVLPLSEQMERLTERQRLLKPQD